MTCVVGKPVLDSVEPVCLHFGGGSVVQLRCWGEDVADLLIAKSKETDTSRGIVNCGTTERDEEVRVSRLCVEMHEC